MKFQFSLVFATLATVFINTTYSRSISDVNNLTNDIDSIKQSTGWKNISVRENADLHLSLISQGKYNKKSDSKYDNNYYYPDSAGEGIDIIFVDTGFNFNHSEFSNKSERTTKCLARVVDGKIDESVSPDNCGTNDPIYTNANSYHGEWASDVAAGLKHGAAPKANVYGIAAIPSSDGSMSNFITSLQYISDSNIIRPNKTVISLSLGAFYPIKGENAERDQWVKVIKEITDKGAIVVAASHNFGKDTYNTKANKQMYPCVLDDVICVGGTEIIEGLEVNELELLRETAKYPIHHSNMDPKEVESKSKEIDALSLEELKALPEIEDGLKKDNNDYNINLIDIVEMEMQEKQYEKIIQQNPDNVTIKYQLAGWSDFGRDVDIYAPGYFHAEYQNINSEDKEIYSAGTSFATPITAGVVASIMSENSDINFTSKTMLEYLQKNGLKNVICGIPEGYPNLFLNNGKNDGSNDKEQSVSEECASQIKQTSQSSDAHSIKNTKNVMIAAAAVAVAIIVIVLI